jgi:hypothetical protein
MCLKAINPSPLPRIDLTSYKASRDQLSTRQTVKSSMLITALGLKNLRTVRHLDVMFLRVY